MPHIPATIGLPDTARYRPYSVAEALDHYDERLRAGRDVLARPIATGFAFLDQSSAREVEQRLLTPEGASTLHPTAVAPEIPAPATPLVDRSSQHP